VGSHQLSVLSFTILNYETFHMSEQLTKTALLNPSQIRLVKLRTS